MGNWTISAEIRVIDSPKVASIGKMLWSSEVILTLLPFAAFTAASPTFQRSRDKFDWSSKKSLLVPLPSLSSYYLSYIQCLNLEEHGIDIHHSIAFGDSYTYVQGTHGHQNYSFIGDQLNFSYDAQTLLSNKIVQNQVSTSSFVPAFEVLLSNRKRKQTSNLDTFRLQPQREVPTGSNTSPNAV